jgi:hypothetical protein
MPVDVDGEWFYSAGGDKLTGTLTEMGLAFKEGKIDSTTLVWQETMLDWAPLSQLPEVLAILSPGTYSVA